MGQDIRQFWADVDSEEKVQKKEAALRQSKAAEAGDLSFLEGQDIPNALFMTSVYRRDFGQEWRAGRVCLANMNLAARRIVEGSHRRATAEEIAEHLATTKRNYQRCVDEENQRQGKRVVTVEAVAPHKVAK